MKDKKRTTVALVSLGCPKNLVDSERICAHLAEAGLVVGAPMDAADVIVVNTCGFLEAARAESLAVLREAVAHKRSGRAKRVVVAGCLVSRDAETLYDLVPGIDAIVGVNDRERILSAVTGTGRVTLTGECDGAILSDAGRFRLTAPHTAYLRIAEGCSRRCAFCTIPAIRGPFRSKPLVDILDEADELLHDGAVELNLIAQDTTAYGRDLGMKHGLAKLLMELDALVIGCGLDAWVRLMYAYPHGFSERIIHMMAAMETVVPYLDIPLQHVNDTILRRMHRGVSRGGTEKLLDSLRTAMPHIAIRTAFIVGFPGETETQFEELVDFVRRQEFEAVGVFEYSPEAGTPAADLPRPVPDEVKAQRRERLMLVQQEIVFARNGDRVGAEIDVLVDGTDARGRTVGRFYGQAPEVDAVCLLTEPREAGGIVRGTVVDFDAYDLVVEPE